MTVDLNNVVVYRLTDILLKYYTYILQILVFSNKCSRSHNDEYKYNNRFSLIKGRVRNNIRAAAHILYIVQNLNRRYTSGGTYSFITTTLTASLCAVKRRSTASKDSKLAIT